MTDFYGFKGAAKRLEDIDLPRIAETIGVGEDELHAFMDVEAAGSGFDSKGRPKALYEPHVAYRNSKGETRKRLVAAGLAYPKWGEKPYPKDSYPRILKALAIDETVALLATSWGATQVLGENYKLAGYSSPQAMVLAFMSDEENHIAAAVAFIESAGIADDMRVLAALTRPTTPADCIPIVRVYNGTGYAKNGYHVKFAAAHNKWRKIKDTPYERSTPAAATPILDAPAGEDEATIRSVQQKLRDLGYPEVGEIDGKPPGTRTQGAILSFRADNGLPLIPVIDPQLLAALMTASPRPIARARAEATTEDLKEKSATVAGLDWMKKGGLATVAASVVGGGVDLQSKLEQFKSVTDTISSLASWVVPALLGLAIVLGAAWLIRRQVQAYREGRKV